MTPVLCVMPRREVAVSQYSARSGDLITNGQRQWRHSARH